MIEGPEPHLHPRPVVLLLAAGSARRFGRDKRHALFASRKVLIEQTISLYKQYGLKTYLCLSAAASDDALAEILADNNVRCVRCDRAHEGMGATLAQGVCALENVAAVFVALGDMPVVSLRTLQMLEENADCDSIVYPVHRGRRGHPVLFGSRFLSALGGSSGDQGASRLLKEYADSCRAVTVDDPGVLLDVDTPGDLVRARALFADRAASDTAP